MLKTQLLIGSTSGEKVYSDDVFSSTTFTVSGSGQTINNGVDLAGKGGLVWFKERNTSGPRANILIDTARGVNKFISTNTLFQQNSSSTDLLTSFNSNGFTIGVDSSLYISQGTGRLVSSWSFRKSPKFLDIITYTGNSSGLRQIPHSLGVIPGMIVVKCTSGADSSWKVHHTGFSGGVFEFNTSNAGVADTSQFFGGTSPANYPNSSIFNVDSSLNQNGYTYVAYVFAHDPSVDGIIQCGLYVGNGSFTGPVVNIGWEPQYILIKRRGATGDWYIFDTARGLSNGASEQYLKTNVNSGELSSEYIDLTSTGFQIVSNDVAVNSSGEDYVYMAIRRSNKPPVVGTQVYNAIARTGTGAAATVTGVGFAPDFVISHLRSGATPNCGAWDRLRGPLRQLPTSATNPEFSDTDTITSFNMDGISVGADASNININYALPMSTWFFKRALGVFDQVCYKGNGAYQVIPHSLGVAPELVIYKGRTDSSSPNNMTWPVYSSTLGTAAFILLNTTAASVGVGFEWWASNASTRAAPNASNLYVGTGLQVNGNNDKFVAYLFATKAGISKVGGYTGNGSSLTINAGFTTGARFVLIKRTDSTGDWYVWDTARGIISANDPHLSLNTTVAEVTTDDSVDPDTTGFIVNQVAATNINVTSATYIYLAFA